LTLSAADAGRLARRQSSRTKSCEKDLGLLLAAVLRTRAAQKQIRETPGRHVDSLAAARRACLQAVEDYTAALRSRCLPVPYQLHMELALLRTVCGPSRNDLARKTTAGARSAPSDA